MLSVNGGSTRFATVRVLVDACLALLLVVAAAAAYEVYASPKGNSYWDKPHFRDPYGYMWFQCIDGTTSLWIFVRLANREDGDIDSVTLERFGLDVGLPGNWGTSYPRVIAAWEWDAGQYRGIKLVAPSQLLINGAFLLTVLRIWQYLTVRPSLDERSCYKCHYSLIGNISGICPECGTPITHGATSK